MIYDVGRLIRRYAVGFEVEWREGGRREAGKYMPGKAKRRTASGAIVPLGERRIFASGGALTADDRRLYMAAPLYRPEEAVVLYNGRRYTVMADTDLGEYAGAAVYVLKYVGGEGGKGIV